MSFIMAWPYFKNNMVYTSSALLFSLLTKPCMAKVVKLVYLTHKFTGKLLIGYEIRTYKVNC